MRISKQQSSENKARVVTEAAQLFKQNGFDRVAVADAMRAAGLTHGGFYNHFASKDDLAAEACRQALSTSVGKIAAIAAIEDPTERKAALGAYMRRYISTAARDASAPACPMAAFAGEMPRQPEPLAAVYTEGLRAYLTAFAAAGNGTMPRLEALACFATLAGALILSRSVAKSDQALSDELLEAAKAVVDRPQ